MITYSFLGSNGRLGNQLYQYAALFALGQERNFEVCVPDLRQASWHGQASFLSFLNLSARTLTREDKRAIRGRYIEPDWRRDDPKFFDIQDNTDIFGYFSSLFYFHKYKSQIMQEFQPQGTKLRKAQEYMKAVGLDKVSTPIIAIHLRLGDAVDSSINGSEAEDRLLVYRSGVYREYLSKALSLLPGDSHVLVFTGGARSSRIDAESQALAQEILEGLHFSTMGSQDALTDFLILQQVDHIILSYASSFGWWGAYLNNSPNKIVVAPKNYLGLQTPFEKPNYYPHEWLTL